MKPAMGRDAQLSCRCGVVRGVTRDAGPRTVNRVVCYCDDCQAFLHHLRRTDLLDDHGGTDIVQLAPASLTFDRGTDRITGLRFGPKGLFRWYTTCCRTPIGNTVGPAIPFVGVVAQAFDTTGGGVDSVFGEPVGAILGKFAIGTPPEGSTGLNARLYARAIWMVLAWRLTGKGWPHPFFERRNGQPKYPVTIVTSTEREALQPLCGPHPQAQPGG